VVPASRVEGSGWERGGVVVSAALRKDVSGGKNSNRCSSNTQENIHRTKLE
jgi:hypothetical protein